MGRALVIEIDTNPSPSATAQQILSHGLAVRSEFLAGLTEWQCDILMVSGRDIFVNGENNVVDTINSTSINSGLEIVNWVGENAEQYDIFIMSYVVDSGYRSILKQIPDIIGKPLFMPMPNADNNTAWYVTRNNIINVGAGASTNTRAVGDAIWFYDVASNGSLLTSYTTATVANRATQVVDAGYSSFSDIASILVQNGSNALSWNYTNGFGRLPATLLIPEPEQIPEPETEERQDVESPPVRPGLSVFLSRSNSVLLATTDGGGDVTEYRYRTSIADEWETYTGTELMLPALDWLTYEVQARVSSGGVFTNWSQSAYSTSTATSPIKTFYP